MKNFVALLLLVVAGCQMAQAVEPNDSSAAHAHAFALLNRTVLVNPAPAPSLRCGGDKVITHGDGHTTPCPGCEDCRVKNGMVRTIDLIHPAAYVRTAKLTRQQCADGSCTVDTAADCECTKATGSCDCGTTTATSGDCASGSCGASGSGPVRKLVAARPVRRAVGAISERRPVRRVLGRLFGRR
jgi:hypothetical protein